jgi:hypothetical protein
MAGHMAHAELSRAASACAISAYPWHAGNAATTQVIGFVDTKLRASRPKESSP